MRICHTLLPTTCAAPPPITYICTPYAVINPLEPCHTREHKLIIRGPFPGLISTKNTHPLYTPTYVPSTTPPIISSTPPTPNNHQPPQPTHQDNVIIAMMASIHHL